MFLLKDGIHLFLLSGSFQADVANAEDVDRLFKKSLDTFGGINVVVNCAGIMPLLPITGGDLELFDKVLAPTSEALFWYWGGLLNILLQADTLSLFRVVLLLRHFQHMARISLSKQALRIWFVCLLMNCEAVT
jgi:NAD(P)-dependent dehydrogenase (short-subunit alcohol dehydrogenase family)